jgi:hypothetical protein
VALQQTLDSRAQLLVAGAGRCEIVPSLIDRQSQRRIKDMNGNLYLLAVHAE